MDCDDRYRRHFGLVGADGLRALRAVSVVVAGAGGLGSTVLQLLARTGIGEIHIFDPGVVDAPDLNRQILYTANDIGRQKALCAAEVVRQANPDCAVHAHAEALRLESAVPRAAFVMDCLDTFASRFVLDELFFSRGVPIVHGGVYKYFGQVTVLLPGRTRGMRETFGDGVLELDAERGKPVFPAAVSTVAALQVSEAVKLATGDFKNLLAGRLLSIDVLTNTFETLPLQS